jgi:predicted O-linked N-acetylglucosamine transferase (SPINDLY family)
MASFQSRGIAPGRIELVERLSPAEYFAAYHRIDIALDPFPYTGGTTTCDALWMGLPVVTLAGQTPVGRAGVSILSNALLPHLIATTPDQYLQIAAHLAADIPHLIRLRSGLRQHLGVSPLMNAASFTRGIENAYRSLWQSHTAGPQNAEPRQPPSHGPDGPL